MAYEMFQNYISILSGVLAIGGYIPYIAAIIRRETKPAKASWIIWVAIDTTILLGMMAAHTTNGQIVGVVIGAWITLALALKRGTQGWTTLDKGCLAGAAIGIILWQLSGNPTVGIVISCGVGFIGSFPTFSSAWKNSDHENKTAWTIYFASCVASLIAVPTWDLPNAATPITFFAVTATMMYILITRKRRQT